MVTNSWQRIKAEIANWRVGTLPGIAMIIIIILARITGSLQYLEWQALDNFLRLRPSEPIDERIVIIGIDEKDIESADYPIRDRDLAELLIKLKTYEPRVIGLDIIRNIEVAPGYPELVAAFKSVKNLIAIEKVLPETIKPPPTLPPEQVGFADVMLDADNRLRRSLLLTPINNGNDYKFSLSIRLAATYLDSEGITLENGIKNPEAIRFGDTELPQLLANSGGYVGADAGGVQILINYRSGQARFRTLSLNDIKTGKFNPNWLRNRIVIIGMTAISAKDIINTSAIPSENPGSGQVYGVEIQAHAVSQIISAVKDKRPLLQTWTDIWEYLWIFVWGIIGMTFGRLIHSPLKNILSIGVASIALIAASYLSILWGWWIPVVPALFILVINGIGLAAFYQYERNLKSQIKQHQLIIERAFDTIHNGPLQTLAQLMRNAREHDLPSNQLVSELEHLNQELRAVYESMKRETLTQREILYLGQGIEIDLQVPIHELLYEVYNKTLERDFPCFKTLKVKVPSFEPIDLQHLTIEQKRELCRFLEEALCNVGKHATGVTRLKVTCTCEEGWYTLRITDNGQGVDSVLEGRGTQLSRNLARKLKGKFTRAPLPTKGTVCELTWPVPKRRQSRL
ncbi:possible Sensor with Chase2 domain [Calothrix sp. PCC 7716]|nr:possible Sensor with Chase2 domain [Calothrix sp. PCC 7716]